MSSEIRKIGPPHCDGEGSHSVTEMEVKYKDELLHRMQCPECHISVLVVDIDGGDST